MLTMNGAGHRGAKWKVAFNPLLSTSTFHCHVRMLLVVSIFDRSTLGLGGVDRCSTTEPRWLNQPITSPMEVCAATLRLELKHSLDQLWNDWLVEI